MVLKEDEHEDLHFEPSATISPAFLHGRVVREVRK
jgi:hypothetical protein